MTEDELRDALDGLFAYDVGATDSGIHDEDLRQRVIDTLRALSERDRRAMLARITHDLGMTSGEAVREFNDWLDKDMGV